MKSIQNSILDSREARHDLIKTYIDKYQVVSVKANIPGPNKNNYLSNVIVRYFSSKIRYSFHPLSIINADSSDGYCNLFLFNKDKNLKQDLIVLEESNSIGRFADIDCFYNSDISESRDLPRKCFICDNLAFYCVRTKAHSLLDLLNHMDNVTKTFLYDLIDGLVDESTMEELNLTNKFGLVDKLSSNSHCDMNYELMVKAKEAIKPYIVSMFKEGFESDKDLKSLFLDIREIGKIADAKMFQATNNVNCYQGLIFNLGIVACLCGRTLKSPGNLDTIFDFAKVMVEDLKADKGAIKEAKSGYQNIKYILSKYDLNNSNSYIPCLMDLIVNVDDTILEKRAIKNNVNLVDLKSKFKKALESKDNQLINQLNEYCVENKLSCGGCADLLVVAIFISRFKRLFNY